MEQPSTAPPTTAPREQGIAAAQFNLDTELKRLREIGATADGALGDADPMKAIETILAQLRFDEILLSTLPPGISRWLAWDLPHRVRRRTRTPLTVITWEKASPGTDEPDGPHVEAGPEPSPTSPQTATTA